MVIENFAEVISLLIAICAGIAAIAGIIMLSAFFQNKLKNLFDDVNYFIFFFLVSGYFLYSLGEVAFYLGTWIFGSEARISISDVYWTGGIILLIISFLTLAITLLRRNPDPRKLMALILVGGGLLLLVSLLIFSSSAPPNTSFFIYFYPLSDAIIIGLALSAILFPRQLGAFHTPLLFFFIASSIFLIADTTYSFDAIKGTLLFNTLGQYFYLFAYALSAIAFITMRFQTHTLSLNRN